MGRHSCRADGSRIAAAGNSAGGNMTAAISMMSKDRKGPNIRYQALLISATEVGGLIRECGHIPIRC
ncbi:alpha/beta hydrolase fold domain-containing protein [Bradyrhizobium iriomotense]|uniref:alpha/beta hydrolase fold domain-containing protein n=1 Tax=Bradyrhizobium iriomotense TaxID=441950 RepID=UPI0032DED4B4